MKKEKQRELYDRETAEIATKIRDLQNKLDGLKEETKECRDSLKGCFKRLAEICADGPSNFDKYGLLYASEDGGEETTEDDEDETEAVETPSADYLAPIFREIVLSDAKTSEESARIAEILDKYNKEKTLSQDDFAFVKELHAKTKKR